MYVVFFWGGPIYLLSWTPLIPPSIIRLFWGLYILLPNYGGEQVLYAFSEKHLTTFELRMRKHKIKAIQEILGCVLYATWWCISAGKTHTDLNSLN